MFGEDKAMFIPNMGRVMPGRNEMLPRLGLLGLAGEPAKSVATKAGP